MQQWTAQVNSITDPVEKSMWALHNIYVAQAEDPILSLVKSWLPCEGQTAAKLPTVEERLTMAPEVQHYANLMKQGRLKLAQYQDGMEVEPTSPQRAVVLVKVDEEQWKVALPEALQKEQLQKVHEQSGHPGQYKTEQLARPRFYIPGVANKVKTTIAECAVCALSLIHI